ncbi:MAG: hypothetical protein N3G21_10365 [Candidatus Hydrogenedentes bacterium]|nr:hypothetical protein [Candidatus Hydrogenedentota bacterium]
MSKKSQLKYLCVAVCVIGVFSFSGCGVPLNATKLEMNGTLVTDVLKAWETKWYKFEVENDNTPYLLIFKNIGDNDDAWLGYQRALFYESEDGLVLLESIEVPPTEPADDIIIEDKAREFRVAPYKGNYYIRLYGYAQPVSENKKYELNYAIGLAKPETYSGATSISPGSSVETLVLGDIFNIYKLEMPAGDAYRLQISGTLNEDIYGNPEDDWKDEILGRIVQINEYGEEFTVTQNINAIEDFIFLLHPDDKNKYYLALTGAAENTATRVKILISNITVSVNPNENPTVPIKGLEAKALELNVQPNSTYKLQTQTEGANPDVLIGYYRVSRDGDISTFYPTAGTITIPNNNTDVYYIIIKGDSKATDANVKVTFGTP